MFGDRLDTDVMLAVNSGMHSVCVLTGVAGVDDIAAATQHTAPTFVMSHVGALAALK